MTTIKFMQKSLLKHGRDYSHKFTEFKGWRTKVTFNCVTHGLFKQYPSNHLSGNGCPYCYKEKRFNDTLTFISKANDTHNRKYTYRNVKYINSRAKVMITCIKHGDFSQVPASHLQGHGCPDCKVEITRRLLVSNKSTFTSKANKVHNFKYDYDNVVYINNRKKVTIRCKKHGLFKQSPTNHLNGNGCPICKSSKGELKVLSFLTKLNITYVREYKLHNSNYRYDFYLPELNILIEYDGIQHYEKYRFNKGKEALKQIKLNDKAKNELASLYDISLIRIPYNKYNVLEDFLLWKLSKIYKYRVKDSWYKGFNELCVGMKLSGTTTNKDVMIHLTYKNGEQKNDRSK